eukprot:g29727.t1
MSLLGIAVGKEKFLNDAKEAINAMMNTQVEADDVQREYIKEASERICTCLKKDRIHVFHLNLRIDEMHAPAASGLDDDDDSYVKVLTGDGKTVRVHTEKFQDMMQSVQLLHTFVTEMEGGYFEAITETAKVLLPLLTATDEMSMLCDEVRGTALQVWSLLIKSARLGAQERGQPNDMAKQLLGTGLQAVFVQLEQNQETEVETDFLHEISSGVAECIKNVGPGVLGSDEVRTLAQRVFALMDQSLQRSAKHASEELKNKQEAIHLPQDQTAGGGGEELHGGDEDDDEQGPAADEDQLRRNYEEILGAMMKVSPAEFLPCLPQCAERIQQWVATKENKVLGLYLVCDLLDNLKEHSESAWPIFMPKIFESIFDDSQLWNVGLVKELQEAPSMRLLLLSPVGGLSGEGWTLLLCTCLVLAGGMLHGVAMAMRKFFGQGAGWGGTWFLPAGHIEYWKQPRWWLGVLCDGTAGLMIWPAMPILAAQVLMPLATVAQLLVAYSLGLFFFREQVSIFNHFGVVLATVGVVGISVTSPLHAAEPGIISVQRWLQPRFLGVLLGCASLPCMAFALNLPKACCWALATAICEALQFLSSRTLADALLTWDQEVHVSAAVAAGLLKGTCILCIMHFQQLGFEAGLSRFVGLFMVATNLLTVAMCLAFFGDQVVVSWNFMGSACSTFLGIWLLNRPEMTRTAAAYAINLAAPLPKFAEASPESFKALAKLLSAPKPKKRDEKAKIAMDNAAISSEKGTLCPPDVQAWDLTLAKLPLKDDCEEAKKVHEKLIDMVLAQNQGLLGADNRNLGSSAQEAKHQQDLVMSEPFRKVLSILAEIYKHEDICSKECDEKILRIFKSLPQNMLVGAASSFTEKQQKKVEKMLHS